jgi:hypothetical protein
MSPCNYIPFEIATLDPESPYLADLFDLDILWTEEGIFINVPSKQ